jgi:hypothetical protein
VVRTMGRKCHGATITWDLWCWMRVERYNAARATVAMAMAMAMAMKRRPRTLSDQPAQPAKKASTHKRGSDRRKMDSSPKQIHPNAKRLQL